MVANYLPRLGSLVLQQKNTELRSVLRHLDTPLMISQEHLKWAHDAFVAAISCDNFEGLRIIWQWIERLACCYPLATLAYLQSVDPIRPPMSLLGPTEPFVYFAVRHGKVTPLRFFLSLPWLNLNVADSHGWTSLILACRLGHEKIVEILMDSGASPFITDLSGNSAICAAILAGHLTLANSILNSQKVTVEQLKRYLMMKTKDLRIPSWDRLEERHLFEQLRDQMKIVAILGRNPVCSHLMSETGVMVTLLSLAQNSVCNCVTTRAIMTAISLIHSAITYPSQLFDSTDCTSNGRLLVNSIMVRHAINAGWPSFCFDYVSKSKIVSKETLMTSCVAVLCLLSLSTISPELLVSRLLDAGPLFRVRFFTLQSELEEMFASSQNCFYDSGMKCSGEAILWFYKLHLVQLIQNRMAIPEPMIISKGIRSRPCKHIKGKQIKSKETESKKPQNHNRLKTEDSQAADQDAKSISNTMTFGKPADPLLHKMATRWQRNKQNPVETEQKTVKLMQPISDEQSARQPIPLTESLRTTNRLICQLPRKQELLETENSLDDIEGEFGPFCNGHSTRQICYACQPWLLRESELKQKNGCDENVAPVLAYFYSFQELLKTVNQGIWHRENPTNLSTVYEEFSSNIQLIQTAEKLIEDMVELQKSTGRTSIWSQMQPLQQRTPVEQISFNTLSRVQLPRLNCRRYTSLHLQLKRTVEVEPEYCTVIHSSNGTLFTPNESIEKRYIIGSCENSKNQMTRMLLALFETSAKPGEKMGVVVKTLTKSDVVDRCVRRLKDFTSEILQLVDGHLLYYRVVETPTRWCLARDPCDWNLDEYIQTFKGHSGYQFTVKRLISEMIKGLDYLHRKVPVLFHGNLKPSNLLIDTYHVLRLVDFCFGRLFTPNYNVTNQQCRLDNGKLDARCWKPVEYYMAGVQYNTKSDIHSAATLSYYMLTEGRGHPFLPFSGKDGSSLELLRSNLLNNSFVIDRVEPLTQEVLELMLANDQSRRPNCSAVLCHPFFWNPIYQHCFLLEVAKILSPNQLNASTQADLDKRLIFELQAVPFNKYGEVDFLKAKTKQTTASWKDSFSADIWQGTSVNEEEFSPDLPGLLAFLLFCDTQMKESHSSFIHVFFSHNEKCSQADFFIATYPQLFSTVFFAIVQSHLKIHPTLTKFFSRYERVFAFLSASRAIETFI